MRLATGAGRREHPARPGSESGGSGTPGPDAPEPCTGEVRAWARPPVLPSPAAASSGPLARGAPRLGMPGRMVAVTGQSPSPAAPQSLSVLEAVLERITYANEDTGYTIARVATERTGPDLLTVVGPLLGAQVGESLRLTGRWSSHPRYGRQFQVHSYTTVLPATIQGIRAYLGSGLIKGIGPVMAERMVAHFGTGILAVIEQRARPADRGARAGAQADQEDRRGVGGAEGDQGSDGVPVRRGGVHVAGRADLQEVRRRLHLGGAPRALPAGVRGVGHRIQDRRHHRPEPSGSRTTARSGSRRGCSTPCPRPPTTGTATCPSPT